MYQFQTIECCHHYCMHRYASGRTTGIVLDSGDGSTHVAPIYEGFVLSNAVNRTDLGGRDISRYLQMLLRKSGISLLSSSEFEVVRNIKEKTCYVSMSVSKEEKENFINGNRHESFALPDGKIIQVCCTTPPMTIVSFLMRGLKHQKYFLTHLCLGVSLHRYLPWFQIHCSE